MKVSTKKSASQTFELIGAGSLRVTIFEAENLSVDDKSDPFCKITADFSNQVFKTHTKRKTGSPVWDQTFPIFVGDLEPTFSLTARIYDREFVGQDLLCEARVGLDVLKADNNYTYEGWFNLEKPKPKGKVKAPAPEPGKNYGRIRIGLKYLPLGDNRGVILRAEAEKDYKFDKMLGKGAFGIVKKAIHKTTNEVYAAKIIDKKRMKPEYKGLLEREIHVMSRLHHPNIVSLIACYDTPKLVVLIMEIVGGGELFQEIISRTTPYYENDAAEFVRQLSSALEYMHSLGIAHRDLKPENLLLTDDKKTIKITDFGFSKDSGDVLRTACGTALYVAPEVLSAATYDTSCDMWSLGVITYILLSAHIPFDGADEQEIFHKIQTANYAFPASLFSGISETAKDFIRKVFVVDPKARMTASDCLNHEWLNTKSHSNEALPAFRSNLAVFTKSQADLKKSEPPRKEISSSSEESDEDGSE